MLPWKAPFERGQECRPLELWLIGWFQISVNAIFEFWSFQENNTEDSSHKLVLQNVALIIITTSTILPYQEQ